MITPKFDLSQTPTHVIVTIRVPHVRVSIDTVQVVLETATTTTDTATTEAAEQDDDEVDCNDCSNGETNDDDNNTKQMSSSSILHFACPPYLLVLNFGSSGQYKFHPLAEEACATYSPQIENGTITLRLQKQIEGQYWDDLDLLGKLVVPKNNTIATRGSPSTSNSNSNSTRWIKEVVATTTTTTTTTEDEDNTGQKQQQQQQEIQEEGYGFLRMFHGIFTDLTRGSDDSVANEMFEKPWDNDDDETVTSVGSLLIPDAAVVDDDDGNHSFRIESVRIRRRQERIAFENEKFDVERYLQDLEIGEDDYVYQCAISTTPHWKQQDNQQQQAGITTTAAATFTTTTTTQPAAAAAASDNDSIVISKLVKLSIDDTENNNKDDEKNIAKTSSTTVDPANITTTSNYFTSDEQLQLTTIPYPILPSQQQQQQQQQRGILLGLLDLLFAYAYDHLLTDGEPTVESAWTVSILSASLSWLDDWLPLPTINTTTSTSVVVHSSIRRSLIYPYIRNLNFAMLVWRHVSTILKYGGGGGGGGGTRCVLRCLLQVRTILDHSELHYLGNKLYIDPYLAWIQQYSTSMQLDEQLCRLAESIDKDVSNYEHLKNQLDLNLSTIEANAFANTDDEDDDSTSDDSSCSSGSDSSSDDDEDDNSENESSSSEDDSEAERTAEPLTKEEKVHSSDLLDAQVGLSSLVIDVDSGKDNPGPKIKRGPIEELE